MAWYLVNARGILSVASPISGVQLHDSRHMFAAVKIKVVPVLFKLSTTP
jgi:hypothetical protein